MGIKLNFPVAATIVTSVLKVVRIVALLQLEDIKVKVADLSSGFMSDGRTYFSSFANIDFCFQTSVAKTLLSQKIWKRVKSPLTHLISSTDNGHPGLAKNRAPT